MVVAVVAVTVVQTPVDQVVEVVAVRNELVPAPFVAAPARQRLALSRVGCADRNDVLVVVTLVFGVQVAVVQVIDVVAVLDPRMTAVLAVPVYVVLVCGMAHRQSLSLLLN
jgi:hypothetical protein